MTSRPGGSAVARVAGDANVLLSAILGRAALQVFTRWNVEVVSTHSVVEEIRDYLPDLAKAQELAPEAAEAQWRMMNVRVIEVGEYQGRMTDARKRIGRRDPDDVELLALALALGIPVWSNDSDFEGTGVEWYTTAQLLKQLSRHKRSEKSGQ